MATLAPRGQRSAVRWIGPSAPVSRSPVPPPRPAMISAAMLTAVSSGVRAPTARPLGGGGRPVRADGGGQPLELVGLRAALAQPVQPLVVGAPGAHGADVGHRQPQ